MQDNKDTMTNPLLSDWQTPFGLPPFEQIEPAHYLPAFEQAMQEHWEEVDRVARQEAPPTFDNTIVALERCGVRLDRISRVFDNLTASHTNAQLQATEREMAPRLAAHHSRILLDSRLYARIDDLHEQRQQLGLDSQSLRVLERYHLDFRQAGAHLQGPQRDRLAAIAEELAGCYTRFSQNVLADEGAFVKVLTQDEELQGLPDFVRATARAAALARGHTDPQAHVITLSRSSLMPFMTFSENRALRQSLWQAWCQRGERLAEHNNLPLIRQILQLRLEQARLLGYANSAEKALADTMAGSPAAARKLLMTVWEPARRRAQEEYNDMLALARQRQPDDPPAQLHAWDWHYWAEQVRRDRYALEESQVKPYLQLSRLTEAMFHVAGQLFGLRFEPLANAPRYTEALQAWEVRDAQGQHVGVFISDNFARNNKRSGAWMSVFRGQSDLDSPVRPLVINNNNFSAPPQGEPALLSLDDARTLFHEFGHGLHGLLSQCRYPRLAGTQVLRDFVEFPSQIMENWLLQPQILQQFARHHLSGEPMPEALIEKILRASRFNQGFATVEYVSSALVDLALHENTRPEDLDPAAFEQDMLTQIGMPPAIGLRHRLPHFLHLFAGDGYASAYYVYLWAEVLEADAFQAFVQSGNLFDPDLAGRLKRHIFTQGNAVEPMQAFQALMGRPPRVEPLLVQRGLSAAALSEV
jgi:peptidyl-dipeptidase Dcp